MAAEDPDVVGLLADETRVAILRALGEHLRTVDGRPSFSELRRRAGVEDSGGFNYHLDQLTDTLVVRTEDGYDLTPFGARVVGLLFSGLLEGGREGPAPYPEACRVCGGSLSVVHEDGVLRVSCAEDHAIQTFLPPRALADRDLLAATEVAWRLSRQQIELALAGVCPVCTGTATTELARAADTGLEVRARCLDCPTQMVALPGDAAATHPAVQGFCWEHGADLRTVRPGALDWMAPGGARVVSEDPLRAVVEVTAGDAALPVTIGPDGGVETVGDAA